ncbi:hypothetical protein [Phreatobacter sp. AB_2022a]|uniref:hypothetical protein n=1 Tax=Phreatobacter sp. AB_2022a TaxID=3003134 RepID=UPI000579B055|nr:hypothetical protein [Phreatobacter sp. AB_2022a]MCZ0734704.1 hypothetical protein [Phreatobacter sp. AB_2022a]CEJ10914.1 hypothetical protein BN1110_01200 [bacterium YEK0313]
MKDLATKDDLNAMLNRVTIDVSLLMAGLLFFFVALAVPSRGHKAPPRLPICATQNAPLTAAMIAKADKLASCR